VKPVEATVSSTRRKPNLERLTDPMPSRIEPCLALLKSKAPVGGDWFYEVKWDGYRLAIHVEPNGVRVITRGGHDWTHRFPAIAAAAKEFGTTMILDGEAVVIDEHGRSDFGMLQQALGGRGGKRIASEAILYAFDLLYFDGRDLTGLNLSDRRLILDQILAGKTGVIRLSEEIDTDGSALLKRACALGLEGVIAKDPTRPYRSGRTGDWLKIKCTQSESFLVVGYEPSTAVRGAVASLLLAAEKEEKLVFVGSVGTGFTHQEARNLKEQLDLLRTSKPAVKVKGKTIVFCEPVLIAEIEFRAWTNDIKLRHASYKGMREAADNAKVYQLE
jgi:bifunctional non-homologous end joining protein LigD